MRVRFTAFNVENDNACRFDYMEIAGTRYCGTEIPDVDGFLAPLTLNFVSGRKTEIKEDVSENLLLFFENYKNHNQ